MHAAPDGRCQSAQQPHVDFVLLPFHVMFLLFPEELYELTTSF